MAADRPFGIFAIGEARLVKGVYDVVSKEPGFRMTGVMSGPKDPIRDIARAAGIGSFGYNKREDAQFPTTVRDLGTDLVLLVDTRAKIPDEILNAGSMGFALQAHNSLVAEFRGQNAGNWPIYLGRQRSGASIHRVTQELDGGEVAEQFMVPIGKTDTAASYYIGKIVPRTIDTMLRVIKVAANGQIEFVSQLDLPYRRTLKYERKFEKYDGYVDFGNISDRVDAEIRGADPNPAASAEVNGMKVDLFGSQIGERADGRPGTLVRLDDNRAALMTGDGVTITLARMRRTGDEAKIPVHEFLPANGIKVGDVFGKIAA